MILQTFFLPCQICRFDFNVGKLMSPSIFHLKYADFILVQDVQDKSNQIRTYPCNLGKIGEKIKE